MSKSFLLEQVRRKPFAAIEFDQPLSLSELPTPALVLDRGALQRNIAKMATYLESHGKGFRPHAKTHKCPLICQQQLAAGAVGVCVAKVGEAVAMVHAGIEQILITSPVTTPLKAQIVAELAELTSELHLVVDSLQGLAVLQQALPTSAVLNILVDMDVAMGRTGVRDMALVLDLIEQIDADPRLTFAGIQHYAGQVMHMASYAERREKSLSLWEEISRRLEQLKDRSIPCNIVTGGGTGTYNIDVEVDATTDLQVGSYTLMDEEYRQIQSANSERFDDFEVSLHVACTTISQPRAGTMTVDGGYKAFASDTVAPVTDDQAGVVFHFGGDEHGILVLPKGEQSLQLGQVLEFVAPHCDPTVNLHDYYWVQEDDGLVHSCWPITARGCAW